MIHVTSPPEPSTFDREARQPGQTWLAKNLNKDGKLPKGKRPPDKWKPFRSGERQRAEFTLERLHLRDGERVIRQRQQWYDLYREGEITLANLEAFAPLIARAVIKRKRDAAT